MAATAYRCSCCELLHTPVFTKGLCPVCKYHQSPEIGQTAKRHREHEEMLRERLEAASKWAEDATKARKEFGDKMHWALKSRDRTIKVLRQISDMHDLRSDGSCKCGLPKNCKIADLLSDAGIQKLIRRVDEYEDELRRKEQLLREFEATGDPDAWEDFVRSTEGVGQPRRDAETA